MPKIPQLHASRCPDCDHPLNFHKQPHIGLLITCGDCGELLEVSQTRPLTLEIALRIDKASRFFRNDQ